MKKKFYAIAHIIILHQGNPDLLNNGVDTLES